MDRTECCVLNGGNGAWAFEPLAVRLAAVLQVDISDQPRRFNYLLQLESLEDSSLQDGFFSFVPVPAIRLASDKRLLAKVFNDRGVPSPQTVLFDQFGEVQQFIQRHGNNKWCLKYPTSCGAHGHRMLSPTDVEPAHWPKPYVVQEFVELNQPEVYRTYCAGGELFGWVARRFPDDRKPSPWVAHARGARYVKLDQAPPSALVSAQSALVATGLWDAFGCVDLLRRPSGEWLVLEVGTDGLVNHVDRDMGDADFERQMEERIAAAFWRAFALIPEAPTV